MNEGKYQTVDESMDEATGEILEGESEFADDQPRYPATGQEIIPPGHERAADGAIMQTVAHTGGNFIDMLEDGAFSQDVHRQLRQVSEQMTAITNATGTKTKGRVTLTIDLEKEGEHFAIRAKVAAKPPELPRPKSIVWSDERGNFTRFPPQQAQMFGMRPARNVP